MTRPTKTTRCQMTTVCMTSRDRCAGGGEVRDRSDERIRSTLLGWCRCSPQRRNDLCCGMDVREYERALDDLGIASWITPSRSDWLVARATKLRFHIDFHSGPLLSQHRAPHPHASERNICTRIVSEVTGLDGRSGGRRAPCRDNRTAAHDSRPPVCHIQTTAPSGYQAANFATRSARVARIVSRRQPGATPSRSR